MGLSTILGVYYLYLQNSHSKKEKEFQEFANKSVLISGLSGDRLYQVQDAYNLYAIKELNNLQSQDSRLANQGEQVLSVFLFTYTIQLLDAIKIQHFDLPKLSASVRKKNALLPEYYYTIAVEMRF